MRIGRSVAVLGIISLAGCHDVTEPTPPSGIGRYDLVANSAREMTYDEQRLADGQQVPGFAGVAYDSTGNVHVWLNDRGSESAARAHFANLLGKGFGTPASRANRNPTMQFHAAKYDYAQLYQFEQMVGRSLGDIRTFVYHSINERANIVELGVEPGTDTTAVRVALRRRTLPDEAVALRFVRPMKFLSGTIQDYAPRKIRGAADLVITGHLHTWRKHRSQRLLDRRPFPHRIALLNAIWKQLRAKRIG